ncbi:MAG TPA: TonB-dependent receptor [Caulobacteraceae bacterium]|jgi:outer membrane receptor protein involved in Fe transport|nr:TonB-dependent receptor [Caulobacteraceae bacterium]
MPVDQPPSVETVMVRAINLPPAAGDAAFSILHLSPQDLGASPRLDEVLETAPGVSTFRRTSSLGANPTTQGLSLRAIAGSGASRALVTLDGVPQNDPFGGWVIWTGLPPETIDSVDIVRGAGAGPYGAGALTGVVALDARSSAPGGIIGDVAMGGLGQVRGAAVASTTIGGARLLVSGSSESSNGWVPVRGDIRGPADTDLTLRDASGSGQLQVDIGRALLSARVASFNEDRGAGTKGALSKDSGGQASLTLSAQPTAEDFGWRLQGWLSTSNLTNDSVSVSADRSTATPADDQYATPATGYGFSAALRRSTPTTSWEVGLDLRGARGESKELFQFQNGAFTHDRVAGGETFTGGVYAEASHTTGGWLVTGGVRVDDWQTFDGKRIETVIATGQTTLDQHPADRGGVLPTARLGLRRNFADGLYWRAAAYAGFRQPTLNELYRPFRVGNNNTLANPDLKPERLYGVETGLGADWRGGAADVTVFYNRLEDAVTNVTIASTPTAITFERENAGSVNAAGIEAEGRQRLDAGVSLEGAVAYTHARVDGGQAAPRLTGLRPAQTPEVTATSGVVWTSQGRLSVRCDLRYESGRFDDDLNTLRIAPGVSLNARADWRLVGRAHLFVRIDNLADAPIQTGQTTPGVKTYDAPRAVLVGLSVGL